MPQFLDLSLALANNIILELTQGEQNFTRKCLQEIHLRNQETSQNHIAMGFIHRGDEYYFPPDTQAEQSKAGDFISLHETLFKDADEIIQTNKMIQAEIRQIDKNLLRAMSKCETRQDFRDVLPDSLSHHIGPGFDRQREVGFTLLDKPVLYKNYMEAVEKILVYQATRLIIQ